MTTATVDRPVHTAMGRQEAEEITQAIKSNFDSLGAMLLQARDRKAYKALGYRSFEGYCQTEFGKSISHAYRLIEDAKALAALEAEIAKQYDEPITLKIPSSQLRPLKELPEMGDKIKAIEYANKLATAEGKQQPTKKHLEIAVFQVSGHKSDDFKSAIENLGFTKGVQIEVTKSLRKDRGFVTKVDKKGRIYVELHNGGAVPIPYDTADLRILSKSEQPSSPANDNIVSKGDRVRIFSQGLQGKTGEIFSWRMGKQASVLVDGESQPTSISYMELEVIEQDTIAVKATNKWEDSQWKFNDNSYYYFEKEHKIISSSWPLGLSLEPYSHESGSPAKFLEEWEKKLAPQLARALTGSASKNTALGISFSKTIDELISGKKTQTRRAWQEDYAKNFIRYFEEGIEIPALSKGRHRGGHERGFIKLTQRPYQQYLSEMSLTDLQEEGGMTATVQEFIDTYFEGQDKLVWVLHFEFISATPSNNTAALIEENQRLREQLADAESAIQEMVRIASATPPLDTAAPADFSIENTADNSTAGSSADSNPEVESFPPALLAAISEQRDKLRETIKTKRYQQPPNPGKLSKKEADAISADRLQKLENSLQELEDFKNLRIGQIVRKRLYPEIKGQIIKLEISVGGMPLIWVVWQNLTEGWEPVTEHHPLTSITVET